MYNVISDHHQEEKNDSEMEGNEETKWKRKKRKIERERERKRELERRKERTIKEKEIGENERARRYIYMSSYIYIYIWAQCEKGKYRVWQTSLRNIFFAGKKKKKNYQVCIVNIPLIFRQVEIFIIYEELRINLLFRINFCGDTRS